MTETIDKSLEITSRERAETVPLARDTWFQGYQKGNELWPQRAYPGINILTIDAVLSDLPIWWEDYTESVLAPSQIKELGKNMSRMHRRANVGLAVPSHARAGEKTMPTSMFQSQWQDVGSIHVTPSIASFVEFTTWDDPIHPDQQLPSMHPYIINRFLSDPRFAEDVEAMKQSAATAREAIFSTDGLALSTTYLNRIAEDRNFAETSDAADLRASAAKLVRSAIRDRLPHEASKGRLNWLHLG